MASKRQTREGGLNGADRRQKIWSKGSYEEVLFLTLSSKDKRQKKYTLKF